VEALTEGKKKKTKGKARDRLDQQRGGVKKTLKETSEDGPSKGLCSFTRKGKQENALVMTDRGSKVKNSSSSEGDCEMRNSIAYRKSEEKVARGCERHTIKEKYVWNDIIVEGQN